MKLAVPSASEPESEEKSQKSPNNQQDLLIKFVSQNLGISGAKAVAASTKNRSLLHLQSFEVERTIWLGHPDNSFSLPGELSCGLWNLLCSYIHQLQIALHLESGVNYLIHQQNGIEQHNLFERMSQLRSSCFLLYALSCSWFCKFLLTLELHISFSIEQILVAALKRTWDFVSGFTTHELLLERPLFTTGAKP